MANESTLTAERLRELLDYDPTTGVFRWRTNGHRRHKAGDSAGGPTGYGYLRIRLDDRLYQCHRLAWLHVYGEWPNGGLDHRNQIKTDNRIANLRLATDAQNRQNEDGPLSNNKSGYRGVTRNNGHWQATICAEGKWRWLGYFDTPEEASAAYLAAKAELHPFWASR